MQTRITANRVYAPIKFDKVSAELTTRLEGKKQWLKTGAFSFEHTPHNMAAFRELYPEMIIIDENPKLVFRDNDINEEYKMKTEPFKHQTDCFERCKDATEYALFLEQGLGKSKVAIDKAGYLYLKGKITGLLLISLKGVHNQWLEGQIPTHLSKQVKYVAHAWNKKQLPFWLKSTDKLAIFSTYIDALSNAPGCKAVADFISFHAGNVLVVLDESHSIKSASSNRTQVAVEVGKLCRYKLIMSGTPITKNVVDLWTQYMFLNEAIIGHRYVSTFKAHYCLLGGFGNKEVVGQKNIEFLQEKLAPYTSVIKKEDALDLPEKIYSEWVFEMTPEQSSIYKQLKENFLLMFESGEIMSISHAASLVLRLQQVTCGVLTTDDGRIIEIDNPRLAELELLLGTLEGKIIIWARFNSDILSIKKLLGDKCVTYYGATSAEDREGAVNKFLDPDSGIDYFVSNPSAGGTGLNLQGLCHTAIYYSNSFNSVHRWQSEDRIHRIGTTENCQYFDMICKKSKDRHILNNLAVKKEISDFTLSDLRQLIEEDL